MISDIENPKDKIRKKVLIKNIEKPKTNFYFKNINLKKTFEKINELRNNGYLIDFEPDITQKDLKGIAIIMVDANKCIGLIDRKNLVEQQYLFEGFIKISI